MSSKQRRRMLRIFGLAALIVAVQPAWPVQIAPVEQPRICE